MARRQNPTDSSTPGPTRRPSPADSPRPRVFRPGNVPHFVSDPASAGGPSGQGGKGPSMDRRTLIAVAGGGAAAAFLGFVGISWFFNRMVPCTVDGSPREAPAGSTVDDLVDLGYVYPQAGNLVAIAAEGEVPTVLAKGGGNPYTLTVNGNEVDPARWRLAAGDVLEFANGTDVTEEVSLQTTEIACGVQVPADIYYLNPIGYVKQWGCKGVSTVETGTVSGRVIDRGVTEEPQDLIIERTGVNPADGRRLVALTFDDGPDPTYTPQYLDILARYGAHATFFNVGSSLGAGEEYEALCKRCVDEGHQVASHTYSHGDPLPDMADDVRNAEIQDTFDLIEQASGVPTQVMRPPYGEFRGINYLRYLQQQGDIAYSAYWTIDSQDWDIALRTGLEDGAAEIVARCTSDGKLALNPDGFNGAIILMHDGGGDRSRDVLALPSVIEAYQVQGFELVTLNEMIAADPAFPAWVSAGVVERPEGAVVPGEDAEVTYAEYQA